MSATQVEEISDKIAAMTDTERTLLFELIRRNNICLTCGCKYAEGSQCWGCYDSPGYDEKE